ncbi:hypothetical protein [Celeribacter sp.]|uniref:hypothetical protein n=1 Tax=Celeribacter sp. TaxID=1890673 RepID=UPI003A911C4E
MKHTLLLTSGLIALAGAATAENTYLHGELGYSELSFDGGPTVKLTKGVLGAGGRVNAFTYDVALAVRGYDSVGFTDEITNFSAMLGYDITPNFTVVAGAERIDVISDTIDQYSIGAEYHLNDYTFGLVYNDFDDEEMLVGFATYDASNYDAYISYINVNGSNDIIMAGVEYQAGAYELTADALTILDGGDTSIAALTGAYYFGNNFRATGELDFGDIYGSSYSRVQIGGGYQIMENTWLDVNAARWDLDGDKISSFELKVSYEFGDREIDSAVGNFSYTDLYNTFPIFEISI